MPTLTVWKFATDAGAKRTLSTLRHVQQKNLSTILDAAAVSWPSDASQPAAEQLQQPAGPAAFDTTLCIAILAIQPDAIVGALAESLADLAVDDDFIAATRSALEPGTSALFLLSSGAIVDQVFDLLNDDGVELIASNLTGATGPARLACPASAQSPCTGRRRAWRRVRSTRIRRPAGGASTRRA